MNKFFVTKNGTFIKCCWSDINTRKMEHIVADMQKKEPDCEFKLYSWDGDLITSILPIMLEANAFEEINWNWDKKLKEEKQILNKIGV